MRPLTIAAVGASAGVLALVTLFPRLDPAAIHATTMGRADAIRRAGEWSARLGVPTSGWKAATSMLDDEKASRYQREFAADPAARLLAPIAWGVLLTRPGGPDRVRVSLAADGRLVEWQSSAPGTAAPSDIFPAMTGAAAGLFTFDAGATDPAWDRPSSKEWPVGLRVESVRRDGGVVAISLRSQYGKSFGDTDSYDLMMFLMGIVVLAGSVMAIVTFVSAWRRGAFTWRLPAAVALLILGWWAVQATVGPAQQDLAFRNAARLAAQKAAAGQQTTGTGGSSSGVFGYIGAVAGPLLLLLFGGAGYGLARNRYRGKWASLELAARGQWARRQVCAPVAAGMLVGVAAAALPFAVAKLTGARITISSVGALAAPMPETGLPNFPVIASAFGFFGFGLPLALRLRRRWARLGATAVVVAAYAIASGSRFDAVGPALAQGIPSAAVALWLFLEFDVLAVAAAIGMARAVRVSAILLAQPAPSLRDAGVRALFLLGAAGAAALYFALRGREAEAEEEPAPYDLEEGPAQSSRERLEAEFAVARKAQQDALPPIPPPAAGFTFDAVCEPALQVGGDLYDFFPLPGGRLGAAVADVSGKGVPAALYMMVTKGLLGAAAQDSGDLRHILQSLNLHLHRACKRKVFVTMAAVALDPESRRVQYGRAGHNPIVWRRARRGETLLLKPGGVGLGMCGAEPFGRSLRLEEFELEPGDALVLYSDGVTEAVNPSMDQYGEERLIRAVEAADGSPAAAVRASILRDLAAFASGAPARDDVTVVAIRAPG